MNDRDKALYMSIAKRVAKQSYAQRLQVGAVLVTQSGLLSIGYNGTFSGDDNTCEYDNGGVLVTKPDVYHAEENVISKLLEEGVPAKGGTMFLTHSPCLMCSKILAKAKIAALYYAEPYRDMSGVEFLRKHGTIVEHL